METTKPFALALRELAIEHDYATGGGNPNWSAVASRLEGVHYETLRRIAAGERPPSTRVMEECARIFSLRADYFLEYRLHLCRRDFDPEAIGFEAALRNLATWMRTRRDESSALGDTFPHIDRPICGLFYATCVASRSWRWHPTLSSDDRSGMYALTNSLLRRLDPDVGAG